MKELIKLELLLSIWYSILSINKWDQLYIPFYTKETNPYLWYYNNTALFVGGGRIVNFKSLAIGTDESFVG